MFAILPRRPFALLLMACAQISMAAEPAVESVEDFARYVAMFNEADSGFVRYYSEDVVFDKGPPEGHLRGREPIVRWYSQLWQDFEETITPMEVAFDRSRGIMIVELRTELRAKRNGVAWRDQVYQQNDRLIVDGAIIYTLENGLITSLRGASEIREIVAAGSGPAEGN